jgi:hypothetical protein
VLGWGTNGTTRVFVTVGRARGRDIHQRYAAGLYRQTLLSLGHSALAEQAVHGVIADEDALASAKDLPARRRLIWNLSGLPVLDPPHCG